MKYPACCVPMKPRGELQCQKVFEQGGDHWGRLNVDNLIMLLTAADEIGYSTLETEKARQFVRRKKVSELSMAIRDSGSEHMVALAAARIGDSHALWGLHEDPNTTDLLNTRNKFGQCCAHIAVLHQQSEIVRQLHAMGRSDLFEVQDGEGMTVVHHAVEQNVVEMLEFLTCNNVPFQSKDRYGRTPIHVAAQSGHIDMISVFNNRDIDFSHRTNRGKTVAHFAAKFGHIEFLRRLIDLKVDLDAVDNDGRGLLTEASKNNKPDIIRLLVHCGLKCKVKDNELLSPAHWAASEGHPEVIRVLFEVGGADALTLCDRTGKTPLHKAALGGHADVIVAFHSLGFDARVYDLSRNTPVHLAAQNGHLDALKALMSICPLNEKNKSGKTPAHVAAWHGKAECVGFLAISGADVLTCKDNNDKLPIDLAREDGHSETIMAIQWIEDKLRAKTP